MFRERRISWDYSICAQLLSPGIQKKWEIMFGKLLCSRGNGRGGPWSGPSRSVCSEIKCNIPEDLKLDVVSVLNAGRLIRRRNLAVVWRAVGRVITQTDRQTDVSIFVLEIGFKVARQCVCVDKLTC